MLKSKVFTALVLALMLAMASSGRLLADDSQPRDHIRFGLPRNSVSCASFTRPKPKIDFIVNHVGTSLQDSSEVRACYDTLSDSDKMQIFSLIAKRKGLGDQLVADMRDARPKGIQPLAYGTVLTPYAGIAFGEWRTAYLYWVDDGARCPTGRGTEYNFAYSFSSNVTNPSSLRANSPWNLLVDSAILYYTVNYGGLRTWYDTNSTVITTCVGDTALSTVGGPDVWRDNAVIYKP